MTKNDKAGAADSVQFLERLAMEFLQPPEDDDIESRETHHALLAARDEIQELRERVSLGEGGSAPALDLIMQAAARGGRIENIGSGGDGSDLIQLIDCIERHPSKPEWKITSTNKTGVLCGRIDLRDESWFHFAPTPLGALRKAWSLFESDMSKRGAAPL